MSDPRPSLDRVTVVLPSGGDVHTILAARPLLPFAPPVLAFVEALGRALRGDRVIRGHPELVALGFWARPANIAQLRIRFDAAYPEAARLPRGRCLHIAPSNVDTIFVYSLLLSMLAGNVNLVRVSSRAGEQANLLMDVFARCLAEADPSVRAATAIIRYEHDRAITDALSSAVNLRIVWGGDETVQLIRQSPLAPGATELVFPNKFSLAVLDAEAWLACPDPERVAREFVNDTLWFGQMACSSPRSVVWLGNEDSTLRASADFWKQIEDAIDAAGFGWEEAFGVAKLLTEQSAAIEEQVTMVPTKSNRVRIVRCDNDALAGKNTGNRFFRETFAENLSDIVALAQPNWQTIVSFGISGNRWRAALGDVTPDGIDRIVPVGTALNFDAIWDGKDLLTAMTRLAVVRV